MLTYSFSKAVADFDIRDINIASSVGLITNFQGSGTEYSFDIVPKIGSSSPVALSIQIPANSVNDAHDNKNALATHSLVYYPPNIFNTNTDSFPSENQDPANITFSSNDNGLQISVYPDFDTIGSLVHLENLVGYLYYAGTDVPLDMTNKNLISGENLLSFNFYPVNSFDRTNSLEFRTEFSTQYESETSRVLQYCS